MDSDADEDSISGSDDISDDGDVDAARCAARPVDENDTATKAGLSVFILEVDGRRVGKSRGGCDGGWETGDGVRVERGSGRRDRHSETRARDVGLGEWDVRRVRYAGRRGCVVGGGSVRRRGTG